MPQTPDPHPPHPAPSAEPQKPPPFHVRHKRTLYVVLASLTLITLALVLLFKHQIPETIDAFERFTDSLIGKIQKVGPVAYFTAYATLPAVGFSLNLFNFTAGLAFADKIGIGWVLFLAAVCINIASALSYWLSCYALRPTMEKLIKRLGYKMPDIPRDEHVTASIVVRMMPGVPFVVQSYLLGLARVRFIPYMIVSFIVRYGWAVVWILLGTTIGSYDAAEESNEFKLIWYILSAVALVVALVIITRWVRKYYTKPKAASQQPSEPPSPLPPHA